ncbi:MAG: DUF4380 domain-containing protein [Kiritimatiellaeota bacterium]|nr:DUF4380 domain-containing protein [Kiritimatiellota bacterium]
MENITFNGWNCIRLANGKVELIITRDVGPRVARFAFIKGKNVFAEVVGQQGGQGEDEYRVRGGHRFWIAPESMPWSYELDNVPYEAATKIKDGVRVRQAPGPVTKIAKQMDITLDPVEAKVKIRHTLTNRGKKAALCAPWALSVMAQKGQAIIPLPAKIAHTDRLTHNQQWSLWGYSDFSDPRWSFIPGYIFLRQDPKRGPTKIGIAHEEKWVAYQTNGDLFVKHFDFKPGAKYPDGGCSFESFTHQEFLELESLGPLVELAPGASVKHDECWELFAGVPLCKSSADVDKHVRPLV